MSFISLPLLNIAEWPGTTPSQADRPASATQAPYLVANDTDAEDR
jgi:hypothetical protein